MSSILGIGKSALAAAQAGLATTGHNIANSATPGYSRQEVVQTSAGGQNFGAGYIGKGTVVADVRRVYSDLLAGNVRSSLSAQNQVNAYYTQINQINGQLADSEGGLSPTLAEFFKGVQDMASNANAAEPRQAVLSNAQAMVARFQALDGQLRELAAGTNSQISSSVETINTHAQQIAKLNDAIERATGSGDGKAANDLLDQRDLAITELSKEVKTSVVKQGNSYNIFIGNGQPLVMGANTYKLTAAASATDPTRIGVGYEINGKVIELNEGALAGGKLGGLMEFRSKSLDPAQNQLGRVAIALASSFNAQHRLGQDLNGDPGGDFFTVARPSIEPSKFNTSSPASAITAAISDASLLTADDYELQYDGASYTVTNRSTGARTSGSFEVATAAIRGVSVSAPSPAMAAGDKFMIRPTVNGATDIRLAINDTSKIAAGSAVISSAPVANTGSGRISAAGVTSSVLLQESALTLTYAGASPGGTLSGFPSDLPVSVTRAGTTTVYPAGTANIPYDTGDTVSVGGVALSGIPTTAGAHAVARPQTTLQFNGGSLSNFPANLDLTVTHADGTTTSYGNMTPATAIPYAEGDKFSFGGVNFTLTGRPANGDTFVLGANTIGQGDNRNAVALGALQTAKTMIGGTATFQQGYGQMVSAVGNKTRELEVTNAAETRYLKQAEADMQADSGVNLDEEATNLLRYQQAYQAAAKIMQMAGQLFDSLLSIAG